MIFFLLLLSEISSFFCECLFQNHNHEHCKHLCASLQELHVLGGKFRSILFPVGNLGNVRRCFLITCLSNEMQNVIWGKCEMNHAGSYGREGKSKADFFFAPSFITWDYWCSLPQASVCTSLPPCLDLTNKIYLKQCNHVWYIKGKIFYKRSSMIKKAHLQFGPHYPPKRCLHQPERLMSLIASSILSSLYIINDHDGHLK